MIWKLGRLKSLFVWMTLEFFNIIIKEQSKF